MSGLAFTGACFSRSSVYWCLLGRLGCCWAFARGVTCFCVLLQAWQLRDLFCKETQLACAYSGRCYGCWVCLIRKLSVHMFAFAGLAVAGLVLSRNSACGCLRLQAWQLLGLFCQETQLAGACVCRRGGCGSLFYKGGNLRVLAWVGVMIDVSAWE